MLDLAILTSLCMTLYDLEGQGYVDDGSAS